MTKDSVQVAFNKAPLSPKQSDIDSAFISPSPIVNQKYKIDSTQKSPLISSKFRDQSQDSFVIPEMNADDVDEMNSNERNDGQDSVQTAPRREDNPRPVRRLLDPVLRKSEPNINNVKPPPGKLLSRNSVAAPSTEGRKSSKKTSVLNKSPFKQGTKGVASREKSVVSLGLSSKKSSTSIAKPRFN